MPQLQLLKTSIYNCIFFPSKLGVSIGRFCLFLLNFRPLGCVPLPRMVRYGASLRPTPPELRNMVPRGVRPTPPELRNIMPGISGITAGIRRNKEIYVKCPRGWVRPSPPELGNMVPRRGPTLPLGIAERRHRNPPSLAKERNPSPTLTPRPWGNEI
jgi:hypothetical protein